MGLNVEKNELARSSIQSRLIETAKSRETDFVWEYLGPKLRMLNLPQWFLRISRRRLSQMYAFVTSQLLRAPVDRIEFTLSTPYINMDSRFDSSLFLSCMDVLGLRDYIDKLRPADCVVLKNTQEFRFLRIFYFALIEAVAYEPKEIPFWLPIYKETVLSYSISGLTFENFLKGFKGFCQSVGRSPKKYARPLDVLLNTYDLLHRLVIEDFIERVQTLQKQSVQNSLYTSDVKETSSLLCETEKPGFDVGIIIPLVEEFREFFSLLENSYRSEQKEGHFYYLFDCQLAKRSIRPYRCVATCIAGMGSTKAALVAERLMKTFRPSTVVVLGIAAGIHEDIRVGDVIVADQVDSYLVSTKAVSKRKRTYFQHAGEIHRPAWEICQEVSNLQFAYPAIYEKWITACQRNLEGLTPNDKAADLVSKNIIRQQPYLFVGHMVSGDVVCASEEFAAWIQTKDRNYKALEMESGGVLETAYSHISPARTLVIRGISDFGDSRKKELDQIGEGALRRYAMRNAARLLWALFEAGGLRQIPSF